MNTRNFPVFETARFPKSFGFRVNVALLEY